MITGKTGPERVEQDAEALEDKYGPLAEVYAENRSEAAELAGDPAAEEHWQKVEEKLREDD